MSIDETIQRKAYGFADGQGVHLSGVLLIEPKGCLLVAARGAVCEHDFSSIPQYDDIQISTHWCSLGVGGCPTSLTSDYDLCHTQLLASKD